MMKIIALLKAKPGLSRTAFIDRYEQHHAPLIVAQIPFFLNYRRTYLSEKLDDSHSGDNAVPDGFDVVTELWYESQDAIDTQIKIMAGGAGEAVARDEEEQFDRSQMLMFKVDEHVTTTGLRLRPAEHNGPPSVRIIGFLSKKPDMRREDFIAYYETHHTRLALNLFVAGGHHLFAGYSRSYPTPGGFLPIGTGGTQTADFDVITDLWFWTEADYQTFLALNQGSAAADVIRADEANLFDCAATRSFRADEYCTSPEAIAAARNEANAGA